VGRPDRGRLTRDRETEAGGAREPQAQVARELDAAERAFQRGDWLSAARRARAIAGGGAEAEKDAARQTLARFRVDPVVPLLFAAAVVFFLIAVIHYA
jgi:hypothetical protein